MADTAAVAAVIRLGDLELADDRFSIHRFSAEDQLRDSLDQVGMIEAPFVWGGEDRRYMVVDGFKRLRWARASGRDEIVCRVFPADTDYEYLWRLRAEGKLFGPPLNTAERAQLIAKAAAVLPLPYLTERLLPALGLPPRGDVLDSWRRLAQAGDELLRAVAADEVCERVALRLLPWSEAERTAMLTLLKELRCSASIQVEILERIGEIALQRDQQPLTVLTEPELQTILQNRQANRRQKTLVVRELLNRWRFPRLRAREERFARSVQALQLPRGVRLQPPPAFEGEDWRLEITFASPEELHSLLAKMQSCSRFQSLAAVLEGGGAPRPGVASAALGDGKER